MAAKTREQPRSPWRAGEGTVHPVCTSVYPSVVSATCRLLCALHHSAPCVQLPPPDPAPHGEVGGLVQLWRHGLRLPRESVLSPDPVPERPVGWAQPLEPPLMSPHSALKGESCLQAQNQGLDPLEQLQPQPQREALQLRRGKCSVRGRPHPSLQGLPVSSNPKMQLLSPWPGDPYLHFGALLSCRRPLFQGGQPGAQPHPWQWISPLLPAGCTTRGPCHTHSRVLCPGETSCLLSQDQPFLC